MSMIQGLTGLIVLNIDVTGTTSIDFLSGLTQLESLAIRWDPIQDLSPLAGLNGLTTLWMDGVLGTTDISPVAGLSNLVGLGIGHLNHEEHGTPDLSHLAGLDRLEHLWANGLDLKSLEEIGHLTLTILNVSDNALTSLDELANMGSLETLNAHWNEIGALPADMSGMASLKVLTIYENEAIDDLAPLAAVTSLERLHAGDSDVSDISPLNGLPSLTELHIWRAQLESVPEVPESVVNLQLNENRIRDIAGLSDAANLERLGLMGNLISDLAPLVANADLGEDTIVWLEGNCLDLADTETQDWIAELQSRGVNVLGVEADSQRPVSECATL